MLVLRCRKEGVDSAQGVPCVRVRRVRHPDNDPPEITIIKHSASNQVIQLQVDGLCFAYPQRVLLREFSACITPGLTLVRGGDGSGKTTLLRLLAGDLAAQAGQLRLGGVSLQSDAHAYQQQIFWVDPKTTALDEVSAQDYFKSLSGLYPSFDASLALELSGTLSLTSHLHKPLYMLSTGSKRKVWLAAAFASGAALTLLDAPFSGLDLASVRQVMALLEGAAAHPSRAWVLADHQAPGDLLLGQVIELGAAD